jgi:hypothetical protein
MRGSGEVEAHVEFGLNGNPAGYIIHGRQEGLSWMVWEVLDEWKMPYPAWDSYSSGRAQSSDVLAGHHGA